MKVRQIKEGGTCIGEVHGEGKGKVNDLESAWSNLDKR